ncbi:MAG: hypothetical protein GNW80_00735 [Asgard group archaeon]|nr:hypothetical protein [Asgard group archaeon]
MSKETKQYDPKSREILYKFWEKLPEQRIVIDYEDDFFKHYARKFTFKILGKGIREKLPSGKIVTRKALNAQEILQELNDALDLKFKIKEEREKYDLSLHSLYFHLQKLEEVGFIQTVAILKEGRHNVAYYSRPAKVVLFKDEYTEDEKIMNAFTSMEKLMKVINPEFDTEEFKKYYEKYNKINGKNLDRIQRKIGEIQDKVYEADIDPNDIQRFLVLISQINPEFVEFFKEILEKINIELW